MTNPEPHPPYDLEDPGSEWLDLPLGNYYGIVRVRRSPFGTAPPRYFWHLGDYRGARAREIPLDLHTALVAFAESYMEETE